MSRPFPYKLCFSFTQQTTKLKSTFNTGITYYTLTWPTLSFFPGKYHREGRVKRGGQKLKDEMNLLERIYMIFSNPFFLRSLHQREIFYPEEKNDNQFSICLDFLFRCFQPKSHLDFQKSGYGHGTNLWYYNIIFWVTFRQTNKNEKDTLLQCFNKKT